MAKPDWGQVVAPAIFILLLAALAAFGHSGLQGEHGLIALRQANALEGELKAELVEIRGARRELESVVRRLDEDSLDLDLLDERARSVLGLARPEEIIIR